MQTFPSPFLLRRRRLSTVVDLSHLSSSSSSSPPIDLLSSKYTVSPPVHPWPHPLTHTRLLRLLRSSSQDPTTALRIFHHALHFTPNYTPTYPSYLALVRLLSQPPRLHLSPVPSLLSSLRSSTLPCGEDLFITLIRAYSLASKPSLSLKIFLSIPTFRVKTSVRAFNALLNAMIQNGRYDLVPILSRNCFKKFGIVPNVFSVECVV